MVECCCAERQLYQVSSMLIVTNNPLMLGAIVMSVVMLSVMAPYLNIRQRFGNQMYHLLESFNNTHKY